MEAPQQWSAAAESGRQRQGTSARNVRSCSMPFAPHDKPPWEKTAPHGRVSLGEDVENAGPHMVADEVAATCFLISRLERREELLMGWMERSCAGELGSVACRGGFD